MDPRIRTDVNKRRDEVLEREYGLLERAERLLGKADYKVIDVGCGPFGLLGRKAVRLAKLQAGSIGVDIDRAGLSKNANVTHRVCASCYSLPFEAESVDFIVCRWVVEHLEFPERAMQEFGRVLRPGGILYIKTPNLWNYGMLLSFMTPTFFHNLFLTATGMRENSSTFYRANTRTRMKRLADEHGFAIHNLELHSNSYMYYSFNKELFLTMRAVSKAVSKVTDCMSQVLLCVMQKDS